MKIEREHFLFLVTALATTVCVTPGCNDPQTPPPEEPRALTTSTQPAYGYAPAQPVAIPVQPTQPPLAPTPQPDPTPPSAPIAATSSSGSGNSTSSSNSNTPPAKGASPYDGTPVTAQSCNPSLNNQAATPAPACTLTAPGPTCESFSDTKKECPTLNALLKPRVAAAAIECLKRKSGTQEICEFNIAGICAYEALGSACLDPAAKSVCNTVVAKCGPPKGHYSKMTRESCEAGVSGVSEAKKKKFISCISEFCRFETCLTYL